LPDVVELDDVVAAAAPLPDERDVMFALADDPDRQAQYPVGWRPDDGNLLIYGIVGAGTTTALASIALSLTRSHTADRVHLYAIDFGTGELDALRVLPHTGAVITASERERQIRLVHHLRSELERRRQLPPDIRDAEARLVVLLDGYAAFSAEYRDLLGMDVLDVFHRVIADGPEAGIHFVIGADRATAIPSAMTSLVRQKLAMRLADRYDYGQFGIPTKALPEFGPGRAIVAETKQLVQIAFAVDGLRSAATRVAEQQPAPEHPPFVIGQLPATVSLAELGVTGHLASRPWRIPIGISEADLGPAWLTAHDGEHVLVTGPSRAGKTTTLVTIAEACRAALPSIAIVTAAPARSPLPSIVAPQRHITPELLAEGAAEIAALDHPVALLVDDADAIDDPLSELEDLLESHRPGLLVAAAGRSDSLRGSFSHWTRALRRSRLGILLRPNLELDGDLIGVNLPRRIAVETAVGRGLLVNGGELEIVQVALPTSP
jgi:DNA segregation ATPase FtsK/SpoIIIE, S-DNA-T family